MKLFVIKLLLIGITLILLGCKNNEVFYVYSKDKSQCISIITEKHSKIRYIINGKHSTLPDKNYIKIDVSDIDPLGDGIWGCWENNGWNLAIEGAVIIESKLDTRKFKFSDKLPRDKWGVPRETNYRGDNCFVFSFYSKNISPQNGEAIIE